KWTLRLSRSSLETMMGERRLRAAAKAAANCGRRSSASAPFAGLDLGKFGGDGKALATGKLRVCRTLRLKAEAGTGLFLRRNADVGNYSTRSTAAKAAPTAQGAQV